jgi:uncharacterized protein (DUF736 family)
MSSFKDSVYAQVSGTVGRVADGRFTIEVKNERAQYPDYVTVWQPDFVVSTGDRVQVKGWLSWRKSERNDRVYVDVSVNKPKLEAHEPAQAAAPTGGDTDVPF